MFVDRTQNGYRRRAPLEEAKVKPTAACVSSLPNPDAEAVRFVSWFWESFSRAPPSKYALQSPSHWLDYFMDWTTALPTLRHALLAVAVTRWSRTCDRPDVLQEGRRLYTESLGLTRKALLDPKQVLHDDVLATTSVMVLYELFDATSESLAGWIDHLTGLSRLLQHRGPQMHTRQASRAIFEHSRYLLMLQHLMARKACVFGRSAWLEEPWRGAEKSVEQRVFDYGLRLSGVFEGCDRALSRQCSSRVEEAMELARRKYRDIRRHQTHS